ncbi:hypothetical protein Vretimale_9965 [Volvox reticuliferus]|uniref:Calnexin n=1 Tax=Volvox reticuliferus TaxID=1737510 RepID=A0A8J4LQ93_9CHLO|nr:hypothetical protein Vretifemale_13753 [Volvox reticuliferus]GIM05496.1 hypothetical protein Vretimale_9965 [Volvox reticuliferus]
MPTSWHSYAFLGLLLYALGRQSLAHSPTVLDTIRSQSFFFETFDSDEWQSRWSHSRDNKYNGRFTTEVVKDWTDKGLKIPEKNKFYGLTALLDAPVDPVVASSPTPLPLVVQYEVKYEDGVTCGGSYLKLLTAEPSFAPDGLVDTTPYSIMFGPDRCGATSKVHLILRHRNPVNGSIAEKHLASSPAPETNDFTHLYTLKIFPDHKYEILVDGKVRSSGSLLDPSTLQPPLLPPRDLPDPDDKKPADWVDVAEIPDLNAVKPGDWDDREMIEDEKAVKPRGWLDNEPALISDPAAKRPEEWDEEEDGVWEPKQIPNPKCKVGCGPWIRPMKRNPAFKGAWKPPLIKNPAYKGPWVQKTIPNPDFFEVEEPIRSGVGAIGAVALELWTIDSGYIFDNILITRDPAVAEIALQKLWKPRHDAEVKASEAKLKEKEQKEKERRKEEEAKQKASREGRNFGERAVSNAVLALFEDDGLLAPVAPYVGPLLDFVRENPDALILGMGVGPMLLLTVILLLRSIGSGKKQSANAPTAAAEEEKPAAEAGEEPLAEAEDDRAADAEPTSAPAPEANQGQEVVPEGDITPDGEIEEEPEEKGPRRRTARAA